MKTSYNIVLDILNESEEFPNLLEFIYPIIDLGLMLYVSFNFDKYLRFGDLIETNSKLYKIDRITSEKFLNTLMYKKSVDDFDDEDIDNINAFTSRIKNKQLFEQNLKKELAFLERNKNNYLLKSYFFINNQSIDNEINKINFILDSA
jgi:hypothetical protein